MRRHISKSPIPCRCNEQLNKNFIVCEKRKSNKSVACSYLSRSLSRNFFHSAKWRSSLYLFVLSMHKFFYANRFLIWVCSELIKRGFIALFLEILLKFSERTIWFADMKFSSRSEAKYNINIIIVYEKLTMLSLRKRSQWHLIRRKKRIEETGCMSHGQFCL